MKPGEITQEPVQTEYGWHVIKVEETRMSQPPSFDEVKPRELAEKLRSEGHKVANNRLRWLAAVSGLEAGQDGEPDTSASGGR